LHHVPNRSGIWLLRTTCRSGGSQVNSYPCVGCDGNLHAPRSLHIHTHPHTEQRTGQVRVAPTYYRGRYRSFADEEPCRSLHNTCIRCVLTLASFTLAGMDARTHGKRVLRIFNLIYVNSTKLPHVQQNLLWCCVHYETTKNIIPCATVACFQCCYVHNSNRPGESAHASMLLSI
jgi:hypothetical protein